MSRVTAATSVASELGLATHVEGDGPPLLFLHGTHGLIFCRPLLQKLAERFSVVAPLHPGWGDSVRRPTDRSVDDLAYHYLDVLDAFDEPVAVVGCSLGAWLALEVATKDDSGIANLTLVSPVGIRSGEPTRRYYLDQYAVPAPTLAAALYGRADRQPDLSGFSDEDFVQLARAEEASTFYAWQPYLHNPSLLARLHRVKTPTQIVTGANDGLVLADEHVATLAAALGGPVRTHVFPDTGHRVEEQRADELADRIAEFALDGAAARRTA